MPKGVSQHHFQVVVGADTEIFDASTGYLGSMHDAKVFRLSGFFNRASQGKIEAFANGPTENINGLDVAPFIVGDGVYPLPYQSLYGLKTYNLSEATNFHIRAS